MSCSAGFQVEKGIPLPQKPSKGSTAAMRALMAADVGDSIWLPLGANPWTTARAISGDVGWIKVSRRTRDGEKGQRVWKIAEPPPR
jgi:hypothetical protein